MSLMKLAEAPIHDTSAVATSTGVQAAAIISIVGSFMGYWPLFAGGVASIFAVIYYVLTILQMPIVQTYLKAKREVRRAKKLARLEAAHKVNTAKIVALQTLKIAQTDASALVDRAKVEADKLVADTAAKNKP
jgi:hypothetical protein